MKVSINDLKKIILIEIKQQGVPTHLHEKFFKNLLSRIGEFILPPPRKGRTSTTNKKKTVEIQKKIESAVDRPGELDSFSKFSRFISGLESVLVPKSGEAIEFFSSNPKLKKWDSYFDNLFKEQSLSAKLFLPLLFKSDPNIRKLLELDPKKISKTQEEQLKKAIQTTLVSPSNMRVFLSQLNDVLSSKTGLSPSVGSQYITKPDEPKTKPDSVSREKKVDFLTPPKKEPAETSSKEKLIKGILQQKQQPPIRKFPEFKPNTPYVLRENLGKIIINEIKLFNKNLK